jgi:uncharacterized protein (UPF0276 family)
VSSSPSANSSGPVPAGAGIGLRSAHHEALVRERPAVGWIEVHTENYFHDGGPQLAALERAREAYPLSLHGVGMGLGSVEPLDRSHVARVARAIARFEPALVSEHACWGSQGGEHFNDLLPLPYTDEAVLHLAGRIAQVQDLLGRQILIENLSCYLSYASSRLTEWEFLAAVVERAGELARCHGLALGDATEDVLVVVRGHARLPRPPLAHRTDLVRVIQWMLSELAVGHS